MALEGQYTHKNTSLVIPNAYWRIMDVSGSKEKGYGAVVAIFYSEEDRNASLDNWLFTLPFRVTADYNENEQPLVTIYNRLKDVALEKYGVTLTDHP